MKALKTLVSMALAILVLAVGVSAALPPVFVSDPVAQTVEESRLLDYTLPAATGTGTLTYSLTGTPTGAAFDAVTHKITWTPTYEQANTYAMVYTVTDDMGTSDTVDDLTATKNFAVTVNNLQPLSIELNVLLGGDNQPRSNHDAEDADRKEAYTEWKSFTITNNGGLPISIALSTTATSSRYNVTFAGVTSTIAANSSITVTAKGKVPEDLVSFFPANPTERRNLIGQLQVDSTTLGVLPATSNLYMQAENILSFDKLKVSVDGDPTTINDPDEEISDVKPGSEIEVKASIENGYDDNDNEDLQIEDITYRVWITDSDLDIDEDIDVDDLDSDTITEESISFDIDREEVEDSTYVMYIQVMGKDENGAVMGEKYAVDLEVKKKTHEIIIDDIQMEPSSAVCQKSATLSFTLINIGKRNEEEVAYKVDAPTLGLAKTEYNIELDSRDDYSKEIVIPLSNIKTGDYEIEISTFYDRNELTDSQSASLHVEACPVVAPVVTPVVTPVVQPAQPQSGMEDTTGNAPVTIVPELESFNEFQNTSIYTMLLGGLVVVLTVALVLLLVKFVF